MTTSRRDGATEEILIPVTEEWNHMYQPSAYFPYGRRPLQRETGEADRVTYSEPYSEECGEPVWFYSWGNARWLRCPIGRPGDVMNDAGDRIADVWIERREDNWVFVVEVQRLRQRNARARIAVAINARNGAKP